MYIVLHYILLCYVTTLPIQCPTKMNLAKMNLQRSRRLSSYTKRFIALFIGLFGVTSSLIAISSYSLPLAHKFGYSHNPFIYALQIIKLLPNLFIYVPRFRRKFYMSIRYMLILIYFEYIPCRLRRIICIVWESLQFQQSWLFGK